MEYLEYIKQNIEAIICFAIFIEIADLIPNITNNT